MAATVNKDSAAASIVVSGVVIDITRVDRELATTDEDSAANDVIHAISVSAGDSYAVKKCEACLLYTSPSPRDQRGSRMPSSA